MKKTTSIILTLSLIASFAFSQKVKPDKGIFKVYNHDSLYYYSTILKDVRASEEKKEPEKTHKRFKMDMTKMKLPNSVDLYKAEWHNKPVSQGNAGTCWAFSTTSFFETESYMVTNQEVKLSEIYTVYWEYIEKARRYVKERGNSLFVEGSEANAVTRMYKMYGIVPWNVYNGLKPGQKFHSHEKMFKEMNSYLESLKISNAWNEQEALSTIKAILNHYLGEPPTEFEIEGKKYTPKQYLKDVLKLKMDDYVDILSYMQEPYYEKVEYKVPDNWWHSKEYYNVPLDVFMEALKNAVHKGFTISIGGDVSESGFSREYQVAMVPSFDIPSEYIDEYARQFRFSNKTTTDDHGMHLVGWQADKDGIEWYLVKDSSSGSRDNDENSKEFGYYFFNEDYIKLKIMDFMVHKDAVEDVLKKFK